MYEPRLGQVTENIAYCQEDIEALKASTESEIAKVTEIFATLDKKADQTQIKSLKTLIEQVASNGIGEAHLKVIRSRMDEKSEKL